METVRRAAALLDKARPGWENEIDTETVDLLSSKDCVLGQVYGDFSTGVVDISNHGYVSRGWETPFSGPDADGRQMRITAWLVEIHQRRAVSAVERVTQLVNA